MTRCPQRISGNDERPVSFSAGLRRARVCAAVLLAACFWPLAMAEPSPLAPYCQANGAPKAPAVFPSTLDTALLMYRMCLHSLPFHPEHRREGELQDRINLHYAIAVLQVADEVPRNDRELQEALIEEFHRHTHGIYR